MKYNPLIQKCQHIQHFFLSFSQTLCFFISPPFLFIPTFKSKKKKKKEQYDSDPQSLNVQWDAERPSATGNKDPKHVTV